MTNNEASAKKPQRRLVITGDADLLLLAAMLTEYDQYRSIRNGQPPTRLSAELRLKIIEILKAPSVRHPEGPLVKDLTSGASPCLSTAEVAKLVGKSPRTILRNPSKYRGVLHGRDYRYPKHFIEQLTGNN